MAKPDNKSIKKETPIQSQEFAFTKLTKQAILFSIVAFVLSFLLYCNTIKHEYALDDLVSITQNSHTLQGFAGIKDLLTKDSFHGYTTFVNLVSGGRYRPLALITFAIEIQLFGKDIPHVSHFGNVLLFAISMSLLFLLCYRFIFKGNMIATVVSCLLFIVHPLHTEVIANIKSRDEIMMLFFSLGAMYFLFEYLANKKNKLLIALSGISFFLALLSKENAILFVVFIPLVLYYFYDCSLKKALLESWMLISVAVIFVLIRFSITGIHSNPQNEILNAPFLWAKPLDAFATKIYILLRYLYLLVFPHPLSCLYTWNAIPYITIFDIKFITAFIVYAIIIYYGIKGFFKKTILSFFILNYLAMILLVSNLVFDIGALMGERFLYLTGLPVILAGGYYFELLYQKKNKVLQSSLIAILAIIVIGYTLRTISRNAAWTNDDTIAIEDRDVYECAHVKLNSASAFSRLSQKEKDPHKKDSLFTLSKLYIKKSLAIYPNYIDGHIIGGSCYYLGGMLDTAVVYYDRAFELSPENLTLKAYFPIIAKDFYDRGQKQLMRNQIDSTAYSFKMAMKHDPVYIQIVRFFYDKALDSYFKKDYKKAMEFLATYMEFKTDDLNVLLLYGDLSYNDKKYERARDLYQRAIKIKPDNLAVIRQLQNIDILLPKTNQTSTQKDSVNNFIIH